MKHANKVCNMVVMCLIVNIAYAEIGAGWHLFHAQDPVKSNNEGFIERFPLYNDDMTPDQDLDKLKLSEAQQHQALVWGLTKDQEKRYVYLMKNKSGFYYQRLTPTQVLLANARTDEERQLFAKKVAFDEFERNAKDLSADTAYHEAALALAKANRLPIIRPFDTRPYSPYSHQPVSIETGDTFMLFVKQSDRVRAITSYLMQAIQHNQNIQLNVYMVGDQVTPAVMSDWARGQNIPRDLVSKKHITLNKDNEKFGLLPPGSQTPALVLVRGKASRLVDLSEF